MRSASLPRFPTFHTVQQTDNMVSNMSLVFLKVPTDAPVPGEHLDKRTKELDVDHVALQGGVLVRVKAVSMDPYMRECMVWQ